MTLTISLTHDAAARLQERARAAGQDLHEYARGIITRELDVPLSLIDAAEPLAKAVDSASEGIGDDEFTSLIVQARDEARRDRKLKQG